MKIAATTASPARRSARADRRKKAIPSGTAVRASPKLWMRSASRAMLPERAKIAVWTAAVAEDRERDRDGADPFAGAFDAVVDEPVGVPGVVVVCPIVVGVMVVPVTMVVIVAVATVRAVLLVGVRAFMCVGVLDAGMAVSLAS
jgi:hypothetical protein